MLLRFSGGRTPHKDAQFGELRDSEAAHPFGEWEAGATAPARASGGLRQIDRPGEGAETPRPKKGGEKPARGATLRERAPNQAERDGLAGALRTPAGEEQGPKPSQAEGTEYHGKERPVLRRVQKYVKHM